MDLPELQVGGFFFCNSATKLTSVQIPIPDFTDSASFCRLHFGAELIKSADTSVCEPDLKALWHHASAILCCSLKVYNNNQPF
jgi:hypothetical protein